MIRNQKIKGTFILGPLFSKWMESILVFVRLFFNWTMIIYSKYLLLHLQQSLYAGVHLLQFLNALTCSPITVFFKCIKLHQILSLFSTIKLAYVLEINIFGKDYSNLNNLFQRYQSPVRIQGVLQRIGTTSDAIKRVSFAITFYKDILPRFFLKFNIKRVLWPLGHIFSKVNGGVVQKFYEFGTQNWPGR